MGFGGGGTKKLICSSSESHQKINACEEGTYLRSINSRTCQFMEYLMSILSAISARAVKCSLVKFSNTGALQKSIQNM